jgi:preprotein translocase subunit SecA
MSFLKKIFGDPNVRELKKIQPLVDKINSLEDGYQKLTNSELKLKSVEFKNRIEKGETLDDLLSEAFAAVRESAKRVLGQRHFDVQLIGGIVLHLGKIAEMKTGEGKTLVSTLPLYLNALSGKGCHLVAPNDYLSRVSGGWMGPVFYALGISVGSITHDFSGIYDPNFTDQLDHGDERLNHWHPSSRADVYKCDIVYGTNNEFGFDYLRDNMAADVSQLAQRELNFAIIDEVDSILIDEARTPLIISSPAEESASLYSQFSSIVKNFKIETDYTVDEKEKAVSLTDEGMKKVEKILGIDNIYDNKTVKLVHHLQEALKAYALFRKNKDYVVKDGEVVIIDEFTGRMLPGRRYNEGLHQAIEAKEGVEVKRESDTLATISFQNFFRMYNKIGGMTGTANTEAEEFYKIYALEVIEIPTHRTVQRIDRDDYIYKNEEGKFNAIIEEVKELQKTGQPVLIGTVSIQKNELLSRLLAKNGIKHQLLNAKHHEKEAKIISQAGKVGSVTIATNMAGRGVDIILGGTAPSDKDEDFKTKVIDWEKEHQKVLELGGLYVIGTERHEARRIDNQLRGRAGRQGDPGASQFYVSMEDDLMRIFGGDKLKSIMDSLGLPDDQPIRHKMISNSIESSQKKVEGYNFEIRKHLVDYDDVMNKHREVIYKKRRKILELVPVKDNWLHEEIKSILEEDETHSFNEKEKNVGLENFRQVEKMVYLRTIDTLWIEHLNTMNELREGIGLRGYGQRDPLVEYKEESYNLFQGLLGTIEKQVVEMLLKIQIQTQPKQAELVADDRKNIVLQGADDSITGGLNQAPQNKKSGVSVKVRNSSNNDSTGLSLPKTGRNDACPCGATKADGNPIKYKHCHGK